MTGDRPSPLTSPLRAPNLLSTLQGVAGGQTVRGFDMRRWIVLGALTTALVAAGCTQPAPSPLDEATIAAVEVPATVVRDVPFDVDVYAEDLGSTDYDVSWRDERTDPSPLHLRSLTCVGSIGSPSPDTPACEYDSNTTTLLSITRSRYELVWTGAKGGTFPLRICAESESDPPDPLPDEACVTKTVSVAS